MIFVDKDGNQLRAVGRGRWGYFRLSFPNETVGGELYKIRDFSRVAYIILYVMLQRNTFTDNRSDSVHCLTFCKAGPERTVGEEVNAKIKEAQQKIGRALNG